MTRATPWRCPRFKLRHHGDESTGTRKPRAGIVRPVDAYGVYLGNAPSQAASRGRWSWSRLKKGSGTRWLTTSVLALALAGIAVWPPVLGPHVLSVAILPLAAPTGDADAPRFSDALTRNPLTGLPMKRAYGRMQVVAGSAAASPAGGAIDALELGCRPMFAGYSKATWCAAAEARSVSELSAPEVVLRAFALRDEDRSFAGQTGAASLVDLALRLEPDLVSITSSHRAYKR